MNTNIYEQEYVETFEHNKFLTVAKNLFGKIVQTIKDFCNCMTAPCPVEAQLEEARQKARSYMTTNHRGAF